MVVFNGSVKQAFTAFELAEDYCVNYVLNDRNGRWERHTNSSWGYQADPYYQSLRIEKTELVGE